MHSTMAKLAIDIGVACGVGDDIAVARASPALASNLSDLGISYVNQCGGEFP